MISLNFSDAIKFAWKAVGEKGDDYVYVNEDIPGSRNCLYVHGRFDRNWRPGCLVGNILHRAGVSLNYMESRGGSASDLLKDLERDEIIGVDSGAKSFLVIVQSLQDERIPWKVAIAAASNAAYSIRE
jgi:hypothetical protein